MLFHYADVFNTELIPFFVFIKCILFHSFHSSIVTYRSIGYITVEIVDHFLSGWIVTSLNGLVVFKCNVLQCPSNSAMCSMEIAGQECIPLEQHIEAKIPSHSCEAAVATVNAKPIERTLPLVGSRKRKPRIVRRIVAEEFTSVCFPSLKETVDIYTSTKRNRGRKVFHSNVAEIQLSVQSVRDERFVLYT